MWSLGRRLGRVVAPEEPCSEWCLRPDTPGPCRRRVKTGSGTRLCDRTAAAVTLPGMTPEVEQFRAALDRLRAGVLRKLSGLSDEDARRSTVDSGTNLAGLIQHLTFVESMWFEEFVADGKAARGVRSMRVDPSVSLRTLRADYRAACVASNAIIASVGDADTPVTGNGKTRDLRSVLLAVIEETARHAGHADIIREQIDGQTGR